MSYWDITPIYPSVLYNCTVLYSTDLLSVLPACMYRECTIILRTVRTGMTYRYGRCTIGMVPLPYVPMRYDCHVLCYRTTVRTWNSTTVPTRVLLYDWLSCLYDSPNGSLLISTYYSVRSIYITDHSRLRIYYTGRTPSPVRYVRTYGRVGYYLRRLRVYYDCHVPC